MGIEIRSFAIGQADCFLIKIEKGGRKFNLLVDCGKVGLYEEIMVELGDDALDGVVVTHIDNDHIIGIIDLLRESKQEMFSTETFFIYNKYDESLISYENGRVLLEVIKEKIGQKLLIKSYARNYHKENSVIKRRRKEAKLPVQILSKKQRMLKDRKSLEKNVVYLTMLSPEMETLKKFMRNWKGKKENASITNKSSIAFLLEFNDKSILMLGDSYVSEACKDLDKLRGLEHIDFVKISHHGAAQNNKGLPEIVKKYSCKVAVVTMRKEQDSKLTHPDRNLIGMLNMEGCQVYTSTKYKSENVSDMVNRIKIQGKWIF